jgi:hypothetical protein
MDQENVMKSPGDKYADYADHPRYGRRPRITGLNPDPIDPNVQLHWNAISRTEFETRYDVSAYERDIKRIPNTAIPADLTRQTAATMAVTHYFDLDRPCRDCARRFIFFAAEQKHWYEELGFVLESDCVRCVDCRKSQQGLAQKAQRYEELFHEPNRTSEQNLEMAECSVVLMESSIFSRRQTQRVRMLLNKAADIGDVTLRSRLDNLLARVRALEKGGRANSPPGSGGAVD